MNVELSPAEFWDRKILGWEKARYSGVSAWNPFAWTVRARLKLAGELLLENFSSGYRVADLGCGSGLLAERLVTLDGIGYRGVDISVRAIAEAKRKFSTLTRFSFEAGDVRAMKGIEADLTVMLGLSDWISAEEFGALLGEVRSGRVIFSFTESRVRWSGAPYRAYRRCLDRKSGKNSARSYSEQEILSLLRSAGFTLESIRRDLALGPGRLVVAEKMK